jgi:hypothetical protein
MQISARAFFTALHGLLFRGFFLLAVFGLLVELIRSNYSAQPSELTQPGRLLAALYLCGAVILGWAAVFAGAYVVYPWYRAAPTEGAAELAGFPQSLLLASSTTAGWHRLGMEWKEHIAWFAPIASTMVAYVLTQQRAAVRAYPQVRKAILTFAFVAFASAGLAAFFGAMMNKHAPVRGGSEIHLLKEP